MKDGDKTKGQLIAELREMRQRVAELEQPEEAYKIQEKLQESEEKLKQNIVFLNAIINALPGIVSVVDTNFNVLVAIENNLKKSEEKYRALINGMRDTAWVIDLDGNFIDTNSAAAEILGYSREEFLSMGPTDIDSKLDAETIENLIKKMPSDKLQIFETILSGKDGNLIPVEIQSSEGVSPSKKSSLLPKCSPNRPNFHYAAATRNCRRTLPRTCGR